MLKPCKGLFPCQTVFLAVSCPEIARKVLFFSKLFHDTDKYQDSLCGEMWRDNQQLDHLKDLSYFNDGAINTFDTFEMTVGNMNNQQIIIFSTSYFGYTFSGIK